MPEQRIAMPCESCAAVPGGGGGGKPAAPGTATPACLHFCSCRPPAFGSTTDALGGPSRRCRCQQTCGRHGRARCAAGRSRVGRCMR